MFVRNAWYAAAWADEVTQAPLARIYLNEPVVLFRTHSGEVVALEDRCCHRGVPLKFGQVIGDRLQCGYHGLEFDTAGQCVRVPGQDYVPPGARVRSYPVVEQDRLVWIWMGDPARADASQIVRFPYHDDPRWPYKSTTMHIHAGYRLMIDNLLDLTHLAFVHKRTIGGNPQAHTTAKMKTDRTARGVRFIRWLLDCAPPPAYTKMVDFKGQVDRWMEFEFVAPSAVLQFTGALDVGAGAYEHGNRDGGFALRIFHGITPETENSLHYLWSSCHGFRQDEPAVTSELFDAIELTFMEDKLILEEQARNLARSPAAALCDINADVARIQAGRVLDRMLAEEQATSGETVTL